MIAETKRAEDTPAPNQYKHSDKAVKPSRYKNIHLGTDKKVTLKEINFSPGPGQYERLDEQYPRTFHHTSKHGPTAQPLFTQSAKQSSDQQSFKNLMRSADNGEEMILMSDLGNVAASANGSKPHTA